MHRCLLPVLATSIACSGGTSSEMERRLAEDRLLQEQRAAEAAEWEALRAETAEAARVALGARLKLSAEEVSASWSVEVMAHGLAVGMIDQESGLCAVLHHWEDALIVSGVGRPPPLPVGEDILVRGISDARFGDMVHARDDFMELSLWSRRSCGGTAPR